MTLPTLAVQPRGARMLYFIQLAVLLATYFAMRLPHLRDLPMFCDEATYLRWAQLIHQDPLHCAFVSMEDAKFPFHYWLLALAWPLNSDPIYMGRLVSVLCGALAIPAILALCKELGRLVKTADSWGPVTVLLMIFCPLIAINQRMALAESLVLLESIIVAWLSLRFARRIGEELPRKSLRWDAVVLGVVWAAALLTKQNFSYLMWLLPPAAFVAACKTWRTHLRIFMRGYLLATVIGLVCFIPVVFTSDTYHLSARLFYKRVFFANQLGRSRTMMLLDNLHEVFWPGLANESVVWWPHNDQLLVKGGILWFYLTPPLMLVSLAAWCAMLYRKLWPLVAFITTWTLALFGLTIVLGSLVFSRYLVAGVFPWLLAVAWLLSALAAKLRAHLGNAAAIPSVGAFVLILIWPLFACTIYVLDWRSPVFNKWDRYQYISGTPAGQAMQQAMQWLRRRAAEGPITIVTLPGLSFVGDRTWLTLKGTPNIQLICDEFEPPLQKSTLGDSNFWVGTEQWITSRKANIHIPPNAVVYCLSVAQFNPEFGELEYNPDRPALGPGAEPIQVFANPRYTSNVPTMSVVTIWRIFPAVGAVRSANRN